MGVKERQRLRQQAKHKKEQLDRLREQQNTQSADCEVLPLSLCSCICWLLPRTSCYPVCL